MNCLDLDSPAGELALHLMDVANNALVRDGFIVHFGAILRPDGSIEDRGFYVGEPVANEADYIALLTEALQAEALAGRAKAVGQASDVQTPSGIDRVFPDSVLITVESATEATKLFFPFHISKTLWQKATGKAPKGGWEPRFEDPVAFDAKPRYFTR